MKDRPGMIPGTTMGKVICGVVIFFLLATSAYGTAVQVINFPALMSMVQKMVTQAITDKIKNRGSDQMALQTRNIMKRLFSYAIAREKMTSNPAAAGVINTRILRSARSRVCGIAAASAAAACVANVGSSTVAKAVPTSPSGR